MDGIVSKFPKIVHKTFEIFYLSCQNVDTFQKKKQIIFTVLIRFNFLELAKTLFHGIVNKNIYRFHLSDFICSLNNHQTIFNFTVSLVYVFAIKLFIKILFNCNQSEVFNPTYLKFLESDTETKLIERHSFRRKEATEYLKIVDFLMNFIKVNIAIFYSGITVAVLRGLIIAYENLPFQSVLLFSVPNSINLLIIYLLNYLITICFYSIYWFDCIFQSKKLTSLSHKIRIRDVSSHRKSDTIKYPNELNRILRQRYNRQKEYNYTLTIYFVGISVISYAFPYIFLFGDDDLVSFTFCIILYVQALLFSIYSIILASSYLNNGVSIKNRF